VTYAKFDDITATAVGYYVYALRDPRDKSVFYVGKGKGNRWFEHIAAARTSDNDSSLKLNRIREIESSGQDVEAFLIRFGLHSEKLAYEVEGAVLHVLRLLDHAGSNPSFDLTNIAEAHHPERGLASVDIVQSMFNAPRAPDITEPTGIFKIGVLWYPEMTRADVREATSGWWSAKNVAKRKATARYAFGVSAGIIRGVYRISPEMWRERREGDRDWHHDLGKAPRWGFPDCEEAPEMTHFLNTSVAHLFKKGDANAVSFFNC
jgi:uncharacterized protein